MDIDRVLDLSSNTGRIMLKSGAETYKVEETINIICEAFNIKNVEILATPTAVMMSVMFNKKIYSVVKKINSRGIDLNKIHKINTFSKKICNNELSIDECEKELNEICKDDKYKECTILACAGLSASMFTFIFKGGATAIISAFIIGALTRYICDKLSDLSINDFFINSFGGAIIATCSIFLHKINAISSIDPIIAGTIMLLVPGLALTNAIRDIMQGKLIAGLMKVAEVLLVGSAIAVGSGTIIGLYIKMGGIY